jgi:hypothetical protein|tara:strand:+ start:249 stop:569 length:321 start_codon:yes stop_codon:yes gene_type:complete
MKYTDIDLSLNDAQDYIRKNGTPDYIRVNGILFTMDWYDEGGREIYYGNKTENKVLEVHTKNRYGNDKFTDAEVVISPMVGYRADILYADETPGTTITKKEMNDDN